MFAVFNYCCIFRMGCSGTVNFTIISKDGNITEDKKKYPDKDLFYRMFPHQRKLYTFIASNFASSNIGKWV